LEMYRDFYSCGKIFSSWWRIFGPPSNEIFGDKPFI